jgi:two-component system, NtrC family, sensor kinase
MKLARKLTLALMVGILLVLAGNAAYRVQREIALFERDSRRDSLLLGRTLAGSVARVWPTVGESQALDLVEDANQREGAVRIRWVWTDVPIVEPDAIDTMPSLEEPGSWGSGVLQFVSQAKGKGALYTYLPVAVPGERPGAIEVRDSLVDERTYVRRTILQALVTTGVLVALCGGIASGLGVLLVGRPAASLIDQARSIGGGDFSRRLHLSQRDEIGELAAEMNTMCELLARTSEKATRETRARIAALEQLRHAERLSTVGQLAAGIAHELGTPLNVVMGRAQLILREHPDGSDSHKNAVIVLEQTKRMTAIIRQLLDFARRGGADKSPESLHHVAQQTATMLDSLAKKHSVQLVLAGDPGLLADVDAGQLQQASTNLVVNAIQAMPGGGDLTIGVEKRRVLPPSDHGGPEAEYLCLYVRDTGQGMAPEVVQHVFEPFFTTKAAGEGTGLGLSVAYGIVKEHGGWIDVESEEGNGSSFTIFLPEHQP